MNKANLANLNDFIGTENYFRVYPRLLITDGVKYLCENASCFWLLDIINSYLSICQKDEMLNDMQFWHLYRYPQPEKHAPSTLGAVLQAVGKLPPPKPEIKTEGGILKHTKVVGNAKEAYVTCDRDDNDTAIVQEIAFTDFPFDVLPELKLYCQRNEGNVFVVCLPSEY